MSWQNCFCATVMQVLACMEGESSPCMNQIAGLNRTRVYELAICKQIQKPHSASRIPPSEPLLGEENDTDRWYPRDLCVYRFHFTEDRGLSAKPCKKAAQPT